MLRLLLCSNEIKSSSQAYGNEQKTLPETSQRPQWTLFVAFQRMQKRREFRYAESAITSSTQEPREKDAHTQNADAGCNGKPD